MLAFFRIQIKLCMFACGSFDDDSVVTLVHVFVVSRVDYCLGLYWLRRQTSCNVSSTQPLESCRTAASTTVDSPTSDDMIRCRLCVRVFKCQHSMAPRYLAELCRPVCSIDGHRHLRSARCGQLDVPRVRLNIQMICDAFCHAGPSAWNALPVCLNNTTLSLSSIRHRLKHFYFSSY